MAKQTKKPNEIIAPEIEAGFVQVINMNPTNGKYMQTEYFTEAVADSEVAQRDGWQRVDSIAPPAAIESEAEITNHDVSDEGEGNTAPPPAAEEQPEVTESTEENTSEQAETAEQPQE